MRANHHKLIVGLSRVQLVHQPVVALVVERANGILVLNPRFLSCLAPEVPPDYEVRPWFHRHDRELASA